jgi:hypothetical protein
MRVGLLCLPLFCAGSPGTCDPFFITSEGLRLRAVSDETGVELIGGFRTVETGGANWTLIIHDHIDRFRLFPDCRVVGDRLNGDGHLIVSGDGFVLRLNRGIDLVFAGQPIPWPELSRCQSP